MTKERITMDFRQNKQSRLTLFMSVLCFAVLASGSLALDWNWQFQEDQEKAGSEEDHKDSEQQADSQPASEAAPPVLIQTSTEDENLKNLAPSLPKVNLKALRIPKKPQVTAMKVPTIPKVPTTSVAVDNTSASVVQHRIKQIIAINNNLKPQVRTHAKELKRISDQARIHQKILDDLQRAKKQRAISVPPDTSELIRQEKMRLIGEETTANLSYVSRLSDSSPEDADVPS